MGFKKFEGNTQSRDGRALYWGRAGVDGLPFRGSGVPLLRDEEFESVTERVSDTCYGTFDTSQPTQKHYDRTYQQVLDGITNDWYKLVYRDTRWTEVEGKPVMFIYVEWVEPHLELKSDYNKGTFLPT